MARISFVRAISLGIALSIVAPSVAVAAPAAFESDDARSLYEAGIEDFDGGEFDGALEKLDRSIELERNTLALYAKAQSLNKLHRCREAVPIYNEVLARLDDDSAARPAVKDALVTCAEKMAEEDAEPAPPPTTETTAPAGGAQTPEPSQIDEPQPQSRKAWYKDPYAPVLIGVGVIGVGLGGHYLSEAVEENERQPELYDEFAQKGERVRRLQIQGGVILGVGGALVLTGAIRYAVLGARGRRTNTALSPSVGPGFAGAAVSGRF